MIPGARCPRLLPGGIVLGNQVGAGGRGDWGWGCVNRRHLPLPSLSCRSLYGPCLGSASVNHVDHPRADHYFRRHSQESAKESASLSRFSHRLCVVSFACAVPSWKPPGTGLVVCVHPVPPTAVALRPRGQYRGEGPARLTCRVVGAVALAVRSGAFMVGFVNGRVQVCVLGLASTKISKTGISDISPRPQYYTTVLPVLHLGIP